MQQMQVLDAMHFGDCDLHGADLMHGGRGECTGQRCIIPMYLCGGSVDRLKRGTTMMHLAGKEGGVEA
jgi:hypothetical protein